jgi:hypothetical protein
VASLNAEVVRPGSVRVDDPGRLARNVNGCAGLPRATLS